jgi:hypothetical protein
LEESIWSLKEFPLDTISWTVRNSHRKDVEFLPPDFRHQSTKIVLPPDERPMSKYNNNAFRLDGGSDGREEFSGDIFLLPYWLPLSRPHPSVPTPWKLGWIGFSHTYPAIPRSPYGHTTTCSMFQPRAVRRGICVRAGNVTATTLVSCGSRLT